jgi:hypothetical protein
MNFKAKWVMAETPTPIRVITKVFPQVTIVPNFQDTSVDGSIYTLEASIIII